MHKNILITGGSGLLGTRLTEMLMQKGYQVSHLSRRSAEGPVLTYQWNVKRKTIDEKALVETDAIIHLAGAGIADKRWNETRKKEILESRTMSTALLFQALKEKPHRVKTFISASAIGYYGFGDSDQMFTEQDGPANDFLALVVKQWEDSVSKVEQLGIRVAKIRIGILLSKRGGALAEMVKPIKWGVGSPLGSGKQYLSWIHIDDVCRLFIKALEDESMSETYNAVTSHPVTNQDLTKAIAEVLGKPLWLPNVPGFVLKLMLGDMADLVLKGSKVSAEKIQNKGFKFLYPDLPGALEQLLKEK